MAPGVFCVWSRADPEGDTGNSDAEDNGELFTDHIAELQGVARGVRLERGEAQSIEEPFTHLVPFLTLYELPDVSYCDEKVFKEAESQCSFKETDAFRPRVYEEIECIEAEGFKGDTILGELISVVTGEAFAEDGEEEFWKFHREEFVGSFMEDPAFIRAQVFKMVGDVGPEVRTIVPTGPYMFVYQWDCPEIPWTEVIAAAQTKGYVKHIESGIKWQGLNYHPIRFTEVQPVREEREEGPESGSVSEEEDEDEEVDGVVESDSSAQEGPDVVEKRSKNLTEPAKAEMRAHEMKEARGIEASPSSEEGVTRNTKEEEALSGADHVRVEKSRKEQADTFATGGDHNSAKLSGGMRSLSMEGNPKSSGKERSGGNTVAGADADSQKVFASVSVADKIRAWEQNTAP